MKKNNYNGFIILSFFIFLLFVYILFYSFTSNLLMLNGFIKKHEKNVFLKKNIYKLLLFSIDLIKKDKQFLVDYPDKKLFNKIVLNDFIIYVEPLSGKIPINFLPYPVLSNLFGKTIASKIITEIYKNDFILNENKLKSILGDDYVKKRENITFYSLLNINVVEPYVFARYYVNMTGLKNEFYNAADYIIFNKKKININNIYLKDAIKLKKYLTEYGFIDIYFADNQFIRKILDYLNISEEKINKIILNKQKINIDFEKINYLNKEQIRMIKKFFITYSPFFNIKIIYKNKNIKEQYNFLIFKKINLKNKKLEFVEIVK